ncbi:MAG: ADP-ribosylglycohydrolase family protein [Bacteroidales bacterium]|nr:ADP-ribosylglycohydrolase family protein [Bacteroidales bacterium]
MNTYHLPCIGAIIGDVVGSIYEFENIKTTDFPFFSRKSDYTDDTIMTIAVADWLANTDRSHMALEDKLVNWAMYNPCPMGGYGESFRRWLFLPEALRDFDNLGNTVKTGKSQRHPYNSFGNGSAMRASACGWAAKTLEEALDLGKRSAEITHNHPEGIIGAQAVAAAIFMARKGESRDAICNYIEREFDYNLDITCDDIRPYYEWESSCQGTVPPAIIAWLDSNDFEEAIRLAISLGGDSDTLACITGAIAQAYYAEIPDFIVERIQSLLPPAFLQVIDQLSKQTIL